MKPPSVPKLITAACFLALVGLAFMVWSVVDPRVLPIMVALTVGQAIGTASLVAFLVAVYLDFRARREAAARAGEAPRDAR